MMADKKTGIEKDQKDCKSEVVDLLRLKAEGLIKQNSLKSASQLSEAEKLKLINELEIYRFELEIQNEELKTARLAAQDAIDLYNFAPSAYFTLSRKAEILAINLSGAQILGKEASKLINSRFDIFVSDNSKLDFQRFLEKLFNDKTNESCEISFSVDERMPVTVYLTGIFKENGLACLLTAIDITERKIAEELLRENAEFLKETQMIAHLGTYSMDITSNTWVSSEVLDQIFGIAADSDKSFEGWASIIHPEWRKEMMDYFVEEVIANKINFDKEYKIIRHQDQAERWVHGLGRLKFDDNLQVISMLGSIQDITDRKLVADAIREKEEKYRYMFANNPQPMFIYDLETLAFLEVNEAAVYHYGFSREEFMTLTLKNIHLAEDIPALLQDIELARYAYNPRGEWKNIKKNGDIIFVELTSHSVISNDRNARHVLVNDITARKQTEEVLKESKMSLEAAQGIAKMGSWEFDFIHQQNKWSKNCLAIFGINPLESDPGFEYFKSRIHPEDLHLINEAFFNIIKNKAPINIDFRIIFADGTYKWLQNNIVPFFKEDQLVKLKGTNIDITEHKLVEEEIILKNKELRLINAEKDKFFAIISHDLRNSFNSFMGLTQIMAEELSSLTMSEIQKFSISMRKSAIMLFRLLENLLEWARIQQGLIPLSPDLFLLLPIIDESMIAVLETAQNKEIKVGYDIPFGIEVYADTNMLQTVIRNLVSNAVKFTPKGGKVHISAKSVPGRLLEISIKDTGIGIHKEMINDLFRLDMNTSRKGTEGEPSSGLGLIICKDFVEKHGGKLWVESEEMKGSTFFFSIPYKAIPEKNRSIQKPISMQGDENLFKNLVVLIAEDDEISMMLITMAIQRFCKKVIKVRTGLDAIETCRTNPDIDLVLMDIQMPIMNGYEATRQIREFNTDIVIIAQTAFALSDVEEKAIASGCNDYMIKPINIEELKQRMLNLLIIK